jgi:hypothetical protein
MQRERQHSPECLESGVGREVREVTPKGNGAQQEVGTRTLDALRAAAIEADGGFLEVGGLKLNVRKGAQVGSSLPPLHIAAPIERIANETLALREPVVRCS